MTHTIKILEIRLAKVTGVFVDAEIDGIKETLFAADQSKEEISNAVRSLIKQRERAAHLESLKGAEWTIED